MTLSHVVRFVRKVIKKILSDCLHILRCIYVRHMLFRLSQHFNLSMTERGIFHEFGKNGLCTEKYCATYWSIYLSKSWQRGTYIGIHDSLNFSRDHTWLCFQAYEAMNQLDSLFKDMFLVAKPQANAFMKVLLSHLNWSNLADVNTFKRSVATISSLSFTLILSILVYVFLPRQLQCSAGGDHGYRRSTQRSQADHSR